MGNNVVAWDRRKGKKWVVGVLHEQWAIIIETLGKRKLQKLLLNSIWYGPAGGKGS